MVVVFPISLVGLIYSISMADLQSGSDSIFSVKVNSISHTRLQIDWFAKR